jgi:hypothetical protein
MIAVALQALATYFRLPARAKAAESEFASITDAEHALEIVIRIESFLLPSRLIDLFGQLFHTLIGNQQIQNCSWEIWIVLE